MGKDDSDNEERHQKRLSERHERSHKEKADKKAQQEQEDRELRCAARRKDGDKMAPGHQVMVEDLVNNPMMNGSIGKLLEYNKGKERWAVLFGNSATHNFKVENLKYLGQEVAEAVQDDEDIPTSKIYITNMASATTEQHLIDLFSGIGSIAREPARNSRGSKQGFQDQWPFAARLYKAGQAGGAGIVEFVDRSSAKAAIRTFNGHMLLGSKIGVAYAGSGGWDKDKDKSSSKSADKSRDRSRSRERLQELEAVKKSVAEKRTLEKIFG